MSAKEAAQLKAKVFAAMEQHIYGPVDEQYDKDLESTINANDLAYNRERLIFLYKGRKFTRHRFSRPPQGIPRLHEDLQEGFDAILAAKKHIDDMERPLVMGYVRKVLNSSKDPVAVLRMFPTTLHRPIWEALQLTGDSMPALGTNEVAEALNVADNCVTALKLRLMTNMLLGGG